MELLKRGLGSILQQCPSVISQVRTFAARKGYRDKKKKTKVKAVIQKRAWIPHNLRTTSSFGVSTAPIRSTEHLKRKTTDDIFVTKYYAMHVFDVKEAVACMRETHHPTLYNQPEAQISLSIELDMSTSKPTKFVDKFHKMAMLPHPFAQDNVPERSVLVFCKTPEQKEAATSAGANLVGGIEIIKDIERGKVVLPDFKFVLAHPTILPEMASIRGLLKRRFPQVKFGTVGTDLGELVTRFKNGVDYSCLKDENHPDFGWIDTTIGRINMDVLKLEENLIALLQNISEERPNRSGPFITRAIMKCPPAGVRYKININKYELDEALDEESSDEDEAETAKA